MPSIPPPLGPSASSIDAAKAAVAAASKAVLNADFKKAITQLQINSTGLMVELDVSAGVIDADFLRPLMIFSPATSASEVILTGKGADAFDPYFGMVLAPGRRLDAEGYLQACTHSGCLQGPTMSGSGQGGTTFSNIPVVVLGGNNAPVVQLRKMRFENAGVDVPAVYIHDKGQLIVEDCIFDRNEAGAIRQLSGVLDVSYSVFTNNGGPSIRGGALALLGGGAKIMQTLFENNNATEGGAIFIESADVTLGNRTTLRKNRADLGSLPDNAYNFGRYFQDNGTTASSPNYVASELHGNSIYCTNGTLRYLLPGPLGHWIGPARESVVNDYGLFSEETFSVVIKQNDRSTFNPQNRKAVDERLEMVSNFRIDEDFPFRCAPGYFREQDTPEAQDGPRCEQICRPGFYCPAGTGTPFACFTGSYCPEGSPYPIPCPKGTWTNRTDLVSPWDCEPCPIGHYCPLNTSAPTQCGIGTFAPTTGHFKCQLCPIGYFQENDKVLGSVMSPWNCSRCVDGFYCPLGTTIEPCFPGEYRNLTSGACVKAPLGHLASLGATDPTECTAGTHADVIGLLTCKLCPAGKYMDARQAIVCKNCTIGDYCLEGATGGTVCLPGTVRLTPGAAKPEDCDPAPLGHYGVGGLPVPCPNGTYQDQMGADSEQDCNKCPQFSTTFDIARTDIADCLCVRGFIEVITPGVGAGRECLCDKGEGIVTAAGIDSCAACPIGKYKPELGNEKCADCPNERWTTPTEGSIPQAACVCKIGFYRAPVTPINGTYRGMSTSRYRPWQFKPEWIGDEFTPRDLSTGIKADPTMRRYLDSTEDECFFCSDSSFVRQGGGTNCTVIGVELETLPILPGFFRERNISRAVRECAIVGACKGGTDTNDQCVPSQTGPYCGLCAENYFPGSDANALCQLCTGSETVTIVVYTVPFFFGCCILGIIYRWFAQTTKKLIMDKLPMAVDILTGEDPEDVWANQLERARKELGEERPHTYGTLQWFNKKSKSMGVRFKIILSLMQVVNGVSICFSLKFPPLFSGLLGWLSLVTFVEIDLPKLMPMGCLFSVDYTSSLVSKTAFPMVIILGLFFAGFVAAKVCAATDSAEWDQDADGEIDRDEFMQAQPQGKFISQLCGATGFFLLFLLYPSATVATFQFFVCDHFNFEGESGYYFLMKDMSIDCEGILWNQWLYYIFGCIVVYPIGVPLYYISILFVNRHDLDRMRRFQIEQEDIEKEKAARRGTISELTISEFERQELMRLLEEAEVERVEKKAEHLERTLPTQIKKLCNGYTWKCYWFEIFECIRKLLLIGIPVFFNAGGVEQRTWGLVVCFVSSILTAGLKPYDEMPDQQLAVLCQFQVFFVVIAGSVLQENPNSPAIDLVLTWMLMLIIVFAFFIDFLDGNSISETIRMIAGEDDLESDGHKEQLRERNFKPRPPTWYDPIVAKITPVLGVLINGVISCGNGTIRRIDWCLGVKNLEEELEAERKKRQELHPELGQRHRLDSWQADENQQELMRTSTFGAGLLEVEREEADLEATGDEDQFMAKEDKLARMLVDAFLNPERVGIEIAIGDLKQSAKTIARRAAKGLAELVQATKGQMEADLKRLAADWPVLTPRGTHLTERFVAEESRLEVVGRSLDDAAKGLFEVQRELRGLAFLSGAEMDHAAGSEGRKRPTDAQEWKQLVAEMVGTTKTTAQRLRVLQKVLDSFPDDADTTNVLKATPQYHPHRRLITELGLASDTVASTLRQLLSLAVAAGAAAEHAPWARQAQMKLDLAQNSSPAKGGDDHTEASDSSRSSVGGDAQQANAGLRARLAAATAGRRDLSRLPIHLMAGAQDSDRDSSGPLESSSRARKRRVSIEMRLAVARSQRLGLDPDDPTTTKPAVASPIAEADESPGAAPWTGGMRRRPVSPSPQRAPSPSFNEPSPSRRGQSPRSGLSPKERLAAAREHRAAARARLEEQLHTPVQLPPPPPPADGNASGDAGADQAPRSGGGVQWV